MPSFEEAVEQLTADGAAFAMHEETIGGQTVPVFDRTPASLRVLFDTMRTRPQNDVYLVYEDERLTFADVVAEIDATGHLLVEHYGVQRGDRVAIGMRNYPEWVTSFAAITSVGAVAVALNAWWTADELEYGLRDSGATVLIADQERAERVAPVLDRLPGLRVVSVRHRGELPAGVDRLEDVRTEGAALPDVEIDPGDDATILYTSGTTGEPKGAVSTHRAVMSALMGFACRSIVNGIMASDTAQGTEPVPHIVHPHRPALPRDRPRAGDARLDTRRQQARGDVQVEPRARARVDRTRAHHDLRRRAHDVLGLARVTRLRRSETRRASRRWAAVVHRPHRSSSSASTTTSPAVDRRSVTA